MTENHSYNTPETGATDWNAPLNDNFERLDTDVEVRDAESELSNYVPKQGTKYFATDTGTVFLGDGSQWVEVPLSVQKTTSDPSDAAVGQLWYRTDTDVVKAQTSDGPAALQFAPTDDTSSDDTTSGDTTTGSGADVLIQMSGSSVLDNYSDFRGGGSSSWSLDDAQSVSQSQSLHGTINAGDSWGANVVWSLGDEGHASNVDQWHQRFQFRLGNDFDMGSDDNCRIFNNALANGSANSGGGGPPSGDDGWSERLYVTERGSRNSGEWNLLAYGYHMDQGGSYGELSTIDGVGLTTGEWHQIDAYCKVNSYSGGSANADGVVRYWFDGELVFERTDRRYTTVDDNRIQWGGPVLFYGGGYDAPSDVHAWYDDHQIWVDSQGPL